MLLKHSTFEALDEEDKIDHSQKANEEEPSSSTMFPQKGELKQNSNVSETFSKNSKHSQVSPLKSQVYSTKPSDPSDPAPILNPKLVPNSPKHSSSSSPPLPSSLAYLLPYKLMLSEGLSNPSLSALRSNLWFQVRLFLYQVIIPPSQTLRLWAIVTLTLLSLATGIYFLKVALKKPFTWRDGLQRGAFELCLFGFFTVNCIAEMGARSESLAYLQIGLTFLCILAQVVVVIWGIVMALIGWIRKKKEPKQNKVIHKEPSNKSSLKRSSESKKDLSLKHRIQVSVRPRAHSGPKLSDGCTKRILGSSQEQLGLSKFAPKENQPEPEPDLNNDLKDEPDKNPVRGNLWSVGDKGLLASPTKKRTTQVKFSFGNENNMLKVPNSGTFPNQRGSLRTVGVHSPKKSFTSSERFLPTRRTHSFKLTANPECNISQDI